MWLGISCGFRKKRREREREKKLENEFMLKKKAAYAIKSQALLLFFGGKTTFTLYRHFVIFSAAFSSLFLRLCLYAVVVFYYRVASERDGARNEKFKFISLRKTVKYLVNNPQIPIRRCSENLSPRNDVLISESSYHLHLSVGAISLALPKISAPKKSAKI
jgi:hypothetical protein